MVLFTKKDLAGAQAQFEKADQLSKNNPIVMNNLGACYRQNGDRKKAMEMYMGANGAGPEVGENMAIVDVLNGNYSAAVGHCSDAKSYNCALAKLLNGDKDGAMSTLDASPDKDSAEGLYLKAVISARKGDANGVVSNLKSSIAKDAAMKPLAKDDREFIPQTQLHAIWAAIDAALRAKPPGARQTLGGLVENCWIEGSVLVQAGILSQQCSLEIPLLAVTGI
jgi:tetratricopeptide (TPR) repeat protein